jgi:tripartite-type tricarboxylate transporter receptor subunit TctC
MRRLRYRVAGAMLAAVAAAAAAQQDYPSRPVRVIVSWAPGGAADLTARVVAQKLAEQLGQQLIVDNRGGASGAIGTELAARSAPDGYTVLVGGVTELVLNPQIVKLPYDAVRDFTVVSPLAFGYYALVVHPSLPARSVKQLIALARSRPGEINYASGGSGSNLSLVAELFKSTAGVNLTHIPYKGGGPAVLAVISGESQVLFAGIATVLQHVDSRRLAALAITGPKRSPLMPDVPTFAESGLKGMDVGLWFALLAPAATPRAIVTRLGTEVSRLAATPDYRAQLAKLGFETVTSTGAQFSTYMKTEIGRWGRVIKDAGVKPD